MAVNPSLSLEAAQRALEGSWLCTLADIAAPERKKVDAAALSPIEAPRSPSLGTTPPHDLRRDSGFVSAYFLTECQLG